MPLSDIEILRKASGQPIVTLYGKAKQKAAELGVCRVHISISHIKQCARGTGDSGRRTTMITVLKKKDMQALDSHMIKNHGHTVAYTHGECGLRHNVGHSRKVQHRYKKSLPCAGMGNNGGDGFAAARQLEAKGYNVGVYLIGKKDRLKGDASDNAAFFGSRITEITDESDANAHFTGLNGCVVIDAIFGIGLSRDVSGLYAHVIDTLNQSGAVIIGCDIPSGIDADTGAVLGTAIRARRKRSRSSAPNRGISCIPAARIRAS